MLTSAHEKRVLRDFVDQHIQSWSKNGIIIHLECARDLPPIKCEVQEFQPKTWELLRQFQYVTDARTGQTERQATNSPPLGMPQVEEKEKKVHDSYLSNIVDQHFPTFAERCYEAEANEFQTGLLRLMGSLCKETSPTSEEVRLSS